METEWFEKNGELILKADALLKLICNSLRENDRQTRRFTTLNSGEWKEKNEYPQLSLDYNI